MSPVPPEFHYKSQDNIDFYYKSNIVQEYDVKYVISKHAGIQAVEDADHNESGTPA